MRILDCEQGSDEWFAARCGKATASEFHSILAKGEGKTRTAYLYRIISERLSGKPADTFTNDNMERGKRLEPKARIAYELVTDSMVQAVGLILHDDLQVAASPDFLVGDDGGGEIKSVLRTTQIETLFAGKMPTAHIPQVQGNLWVSGRKWWDFVSYCPDMPEEFSLIRHRIYRDEAYISNLESEVRRFLADVDQKMAEARYLVGRP